MNKSSQTVYTFELYQRASKSLIKIHFGYSSGMDANLFKIHYKQSAYTTTDNLRTTHLKTRNELTNSHTIYIVRHKN